MLEAARLKLQLGLLLPLFAPVVAAQEAPEPPAVHRAVSVEDLPLELQAGLAGLEPGAAGWVTEEQSAAAQVALKAWVAASWSGDLGGLALTSAFRAATLSPKVSLAFQDGVRVFRGPKLAPAEEHPVEWLLDELRAWSAAEGSGAPGSIKIKTLRHESLEGSRFRTRHLLQSLTLDSAGKRRQVQATWLATWEPDPNGGLPRLSEIEVLDHQTAECAAPLFVDRTAEVLLGPTYEQQLAPSLTYWRERLDAALGVGFLGHHGLAVGDINGDGLEDLYVCQPGGLPNCLFLRRPDGTAIDVAAFAGVDLIDATTSALFVDLDGDSDRDLVLATSQELVLFENDGRGRFQPVQRHAAPHCTSLAAADPDGDGDIDIFACGYLSPYSGSSTPQPYHDAENGQANVYLQNGGDWTFANRAKEVGLDAGGRRFSFAASFEDYDLDGDQDLYVANDFGRNALYRNDGGYFTNAASELGVEDISAGMGVAWGDYNRDGRPDLYISNMYSAAGGRVAFQRRFQEGADAATREQFQRHAPGQQLVSQRWRGRVRRPARRRRCGHGALGLGLDRDRLSA